MVLAAAIAIMAGGAGAAIMAPSQLPLPSGPGVPGVGAAHGDAASRAMTNTDECPRSSRRAGGLDTAKLQQAIASWNASGAESLKARGRSCLLGVGATNKALERVPRLIWSAPNKRETRIL